MKVKPLGPYKLHIRFDDGVAGGVDVARLIKFDGIFAPLKEPKRFAEVFLNRELGTVCWPNGADLDPAVLYSTVTGTSLPSSAVQSSAHVHDLLCFAIECKRLVEFDYQGRNRIAEPHDYGMKDGPKWLLIYHIRGESKSGGLPNWRWVEVDQIRGLRVLEEPFPGGRTVPSGKHKKWDQLFMRVSPAA